MLGTIEQTQTGERALSRWLAWSPLILALLVGAGLRLWSLTSVSANTYYLAGVESMTQSWHNFFYAAAEPGGSVSIDKPPLGLWIQTLFALVLGVKGWVVILPQVLAGIAALPLIYWLVRRYAGHMAGVLAALVLAVTPVSIATDRNNTFDSMLVLFLLLATWALLRYLDHGRRRDLLLWAVFVGLGFNIKMMQALLPMPAWLLLYLLRRPHWRSLLPLSGALALLAAVALAWPMAVQLTPTDQRPYVGSSTNNSIFDLMAGYNGLQRLTGTSAPGGLEPINNFGQTDDGAAAGTPQPFTRPGGAQSGTAGGPGGPGGGTPFAEDVGTPGALRFWTAPLAVQLSWLLALALAGIPLLIFAQRRRWPLTALQAIAAFWGLWLITCVVFFSIAGFFHSYYLVMLSAPLAALVGMVLAQCWQLLCGAGQRGRWLVAGLIVLTLGVQAWLAYDVDLRRWWVWGGLALGVVGAALLLSGRWRRQAFALALAGLLVAPSTVSAMTSASAGGALPAARVTTANGTGFGFGNFNPGDIMGGGVSDEVIDYLQANTQGMRYMLAVPSSMVGANIVLKTGRGVAYLGGFGGQDQVWTLAQFQQQIASGQLRYVLSMGDGMPGMPGMGGQQEINSWVAANCAAVEGLDLGMSFALPPGMDLPNLPSGFPDMPAGGPPSGVPGAAGASGQGLPGLPGGGSAQGLPGLPGGFGMTLYDCGGS